MSKTAAVQLPEFPACLTVPDFKLLKLGQQPTNGNSAATEGEQGLSEDINGSGRDRRFLGAHVIYWARTQAVTTGPEDVVAKRAHLMVRRSNKYI